jgi:hypothetical protein
LLLWLLLFGWLAAAAAAAVAAAVSAAAAAAVLLACLLACCALPCLPAVGPLPAACLRCCCCCCCCCCCAVLLACLPACCALLALPACLGPLFAWPAAAPRVRCVLGLLVCFLLAIASVWALSLWLFLVCVCCAGLACGRSSGSLAGERTWWSALAPTASFLRETFDVWNIRGGKCLFRVTSTVITGLALALTTGSEAVLEQGHFSSDLCTRTCHRIPVTGFPCVSWSPGGGFPLTVLLARSRGLASPSWRQVRCTRAILFVRVGLACDSPAFMAVSTPSPCGCVVLSVQFNGCLHHLAHREGGSACCPHGQGRQCLHRITSAVVSVARAGLLLPNTGDAR